MTSSNKTTQNNSSVIEFIARLTNEQQIDDCQKLITIMTTVSGHEPKMWGPSIIGFDTYHYKYDSGREGDMCVIGFSPRKKELAIYLVDGVNNYTEQLKKLGKHRHGVSCLYVKRLSDIDFDVLKDMISKSYQYVKNRDGTMHRAS
jgi:hypothetical protein